MDISQAKNFIANAIKTRTDELAVFQMASDLLNNTFKADFTNLEVAQKEANDGAAKLSVATAEKADLQTKVATLTQNNTDLTASNIDIQAQLDDATRSAKTAEPVQDLSGPTA